MFNSVIRQYVQGWLELEKAQVGGGFRASSDRPTAASRENPWAGASPVPFSSNSPTAGDDVPWAPIGGGAVQHT